MKSPLLEVDVLSAAMPRKKALWAQFLSGSLTLLAGSGLVGVMNLVYNLAIARLLGPSGFGHATAVYTLLMLMSAVTLSFQIVCAKLVAGHESSAEKAAVYAGLHRRAWMVGIGTGLLLILARDVVAAYLNLPDPVLITFLGLGTAFYIPLGARRGCMQGIYAFNSLAINLILEGLVRLGGAFLLIKLGMGVTGAVLASVAGVILAYIFARPGVQSTSDVKIPASFREGLQAIVFFVGQVIINNFDIVLVKHFFPAEEAGLYAAIALVGRVVNMLAWSVVGTMFPLSAGTRSQHREGRALLMTSLILVLSIVLFVVLGLWIVPSLFWKFTFGARFNLSGYGDISLLLILYAATTGVYSLSSVIIAYEMSRKIVNTGWVQLAASIVLVLGICFFHATLYQVILVQLVMMLLLLLVVLLPVLSSAFILSEAPRPPEIYGRIRKLKSLTEDEIIAEFLKNEFHHLEFDPYRDKLERLAMKPNLNDSDENALRRALLFLRRGAMWRELPDDTRWFEVELTSHDLARIRVFPRAHWRRMAQESYFLGDVVERIRTEYSQRSEDEFFGKLRVLSTLLKNEVINSTVLLIGIDETQPLTILDGNHRIAATMLVEPSSVMKQFRFICGFSPRMAECCWYRTNMGTLWRYAKNIVRYLPHNPESDIGRLLETLS
jgi:O-antigen/teichoic acid export membrane protein